MTYTDSVTLYYDKREPRNRRQYFNSADELYAAKGRTEYIGRGVIASWLGIKNVDVTKSSAQGRCADKHLIDYPGGISGENGGKHHGHE